jgi:branched-chain amino acid transport system substrate-binding protein
VSDTASTPFARRTVLKLLAGGAGAVSVALLGACTSTPPAAAPTTAPAPAAGGSTPAAQQAPAAASGAKGEIKIGLLSGFSGPYAAFGPDMARSADLFLDQHNGLLGGLKVTTIQEDEGTSTQDALSKARKLIQQDKVDVMMGIVSSANALAIRDTIDQSKTPLIITNANANEITSTQKSDYIFRAAVSAWQNGAAMGHWAYQNVGKKFIAMAPDYTAGQQWVAAFKDDFGSVGGTIVDELYPPLGNTDYAPYLAKVKPQKPDGVYAQFAGSDQIKFIQQWTEFIGTSIPLVDSGLNQAICDQVGKAALSSTMGGTAWEPTLDTPVNKAFVEAFQKKYQALPVYGEYHYDAMVLLDKILTANGGDKSSAAIVKGFTDTKEVDSVRGLVKVDPETRGLIVPMFRDQPVDNNGAIKLNIIEKLGTFAPFKRVD